MWKCICGVRNFELTNVCPQCGRIKFGGIKNERL